MDTSKSIVVCEECSRKMRRRPHKFQEWALYTIPDDAYCGGCRKPILDLGTPMLFNLRTRLFAYTYRTLNRGWLPSYTNVTITSTPTTTVWTSNNTSTLDWPSTFG